jgi:hypothetical protein
MYIDFAYTYATSVTSKLVAIDAINNITRTSGYLVINASRSLPLLSVPVPLTAYLKDVKPSGTAGGTATAGSYQTRTLNTVEGDSSIVSLSANQFTLGPGVYEIEASAPAYYCSRHKIKLRNITDSSDALIGGVALTENTTAAGSTSDSIIRGRITLTSPKTFEIQHRVQTTRATNGFGDNTSFGDSEVYTQVKITKKA